jgi:hypothetical protein
LWGRVGVGGRRPDEVRTFQKPYYSCAMGDATEALSGAVLGSALGLALAFDARRRWPGWP